MTDKERLEVIERQLNRAEIKRENLDIEDFQNILEQQLINGNLKWLVKYAREQAKRVQELKEERDEWKDTAQSYYITNQELREQNKRYREVLERIGDPITKVTFADMMELKQLARQALENDTRNIQE